MSIRRAGTVAVLLCVIASGGAAQASGNDDVAGLYTIERVNAKVLPGQTWKREASDTSCATTTQNGTLMMDSRGRWAMLITERDRCTRGTKRWTAPDVSTLSTGTYTNEGGTLTFSDAGLGTTHRAVQSGNRITVTVEGVDPFAGQTATYVARRQRPSRPTKS